MTKKRTIGRRKLPDHLRLPEFLEPMPPVESIRIEFSLNADGIGKIRIVVLCPNGYVFVDETDLDSEAVEWRFADGTKA